MEKVKFSPFGKSLFLISWLLGTIILLAFWISESWFFVWLGFYYVVIAVVVNMIVFCSELITFLTDVSDKKSHGNSALLILLNIPIAAFYFFIFTKI